MPGMLDTVLNLGLNDDSVAGLAAQHRRASGSPGTPTGVSCRCSATSCAGSRRRASSRPCEEAKGRKGVERRHRARRRGAAGADRDLQAPVRGGDRGRVPARAARAAPAGDHGGVRLLGRGAGGRLPPDQRHPRRLGHRGQRPADGLRQPRRPLRLRRRLQPRRANRRADSVGRLPAQRPGRGRRRRHPRPRGPRGAGRAPARGPRPAAATTSRGSSPTTRTCRTSSSRSRRVASSCFRPAPPSAPRTPPSASPSTPSARAC